MTDTPEFSRPYKVDALPPKGRTVDLDPGADELAAIAERLDLIALNSLDGELKLRPEMGRQVSLSGSIRAEIVQTCVVSGEPLTTTIAFDVERTFAEDADPLAGLNTSDEDELTDPDLEEPDPIVDGRIDIGEHTVEELALNIPPYPRVPGAVFEGADTDDGEDNRGENPFAALAGLKDKIKSKD